MIFTWLGDQGYVGQGKKIWDGLGLFQMIKAHRRGVLSKSINVL